MSMDPKDDGANLEADRDQALWQLLGRSRPVEVSPYFARRVLRDLDAGIAGRDPAPSGWRAWWRPAWILAGGTAAVAVALGIFTFSSIPVAQQQPLPMARRAAVSSVPVIAVAPASRAVPAPAAGDAAAAVEVADDVSPQDVDVIADLDNLVAREETNVWTDDTSRF
jgi:hypothetical protein